MSLNTGTFKIPPMDVLKSLVGLGAEDQSVILFEFRMPRMVIAILVGSALAMSGRFCKGYREIHLPIQVLSVLTLEQG